VRSGERSQTVQTTSRSTSVVRCSSRKPSFSATRRDGVFQEPIVAQTRRRPVSNAASSIARAASVAYTRPCARGNNSYASSGSSSEQRPMTIV
jgi:hypothetical protein